MRSFAEWIILREIGQVPSPDRPEAIPVDAVPTYDADKPPTPRENERRWRRVIAMRRMRKR